jgi:hypothetical protein
VSIFDKIGLRMVLWVPLRPVRGRWRRFLQLLDQGERGGEAIPGRGSAPAPVVGTVSAVLHSRHSARRGPSQVIQLRVRPGLAIRATAAPCPG